MPDDFTHQRGERCCSNGLKNNKTAAIDSMVDIIGIFFLISI
jgi:hypothetical protein